MKKKMSKRSKGDASLVDQIKRLVKLKDEVLKSGDKKEGKKIRRQLRKLDHEWKVNYQPKPQPEKK